MNSSYIANYVKLETNEPGTVNKMKEQQRGSQFGEGDESCRVNNEEEKGSGDKSNKREESLDLCIRLCEDQYPLLAERLYRDIQNMELYDVFRNQVLKHPKVCQAFIGELEKKAYTDIKFLFLSNRGKIDKIVSEQMCVVNESEEERSERRRQKALVDRRVDRISYNVRMISWVIYYGHHQLLQYIVQQIDRNNEINELIGIAECTPHQSNYGISACNDQENENSRLVEGSKSGIFKRIKSAISRLFRRKTKAQKSGLSTCAERNIEDIEDSELSESNWLREKYRLLLLACCTGDVQMVRVLLPVCQEAINWVGQVRDYIFYDTPLVTACRGGYSKVVEELVKAGADVNLHGTGLNAKTPLIAACEEGHVSVVKELVKAGADVNFHSTNLISQTPLTEACGRGYVNVVKELVEAGADVNLRDTEGNTPLTAACTKGYECVVQQLLKARADPNLQDQQGHSPLMITSYKNHLSVSSELLKAGAETYFL
jgi:hypothetical protein